MVTKLPAGRTSRDAQAMRVRILDALGKIIVRDGLAAVGINALARETGCDKVLIYRYFGDLDGVYEAFANQSEFWWTVAEMTRDIDPGQMSSADAFKLLLRRSSNAIRRRPVTLAVLAAEPVGRTPLVIALEVVRERRSLELGGWFATHFELPEGLDVAATSTLLGVGMSYLAVRARTIRVMSGVKIKSDRDWERIYAATDAIIDALLAKH